jgi:hypothetical protein
MHAPIASCLHYQPQQEQAAVFSIWLFSVLQTMTRPIGYNGALQVFGPGKTAQ